MPKSKRANVISLTKTKKKTKDHKTALIEKIHSYVDKFQRVFVFSFQNMRTNLLRAVQNELEDSKFVMGKNKVIQVALGRNEEEEYKKNLHFLSKYLKADVGLLFTNKKEKEIITFFEQYSSYEYAKSGTIASADIILEKGNEVFKTFSHSLEPYLRKLGLNTTLEMGKIILNEDYLAAAKGKSLNAEQAKILKLMEIQLAEFRLEMLAFWEKKTQSIKLYKKL